MTESWLTLLGYSLFDDFITHTSSGMRKSVTTPEIHIKVDHSLPTANKGSLRIIPRNPMLAKLTLNTKLAVIMINFCRIDIFYKLLFGLFNAFCDNLLSIGLPSHNPKKSGKHFGFPEFTHYPSVAMLRPEAPLSESPLLLHFTGERKLYRWEDLHKYKVSTNDKANHA